MTSPSQFQTRQSIPFSLEIEPSLNSSTREALNLSSETPFCHSIVLRTPGEEDQVLFGGSSSIPETISFNSLSTFNCELGAQSYAIEGGSVLETLIEAEEGVKRWAMEPRIVIRLTNQNGFSVRGEVRCETCVDAIFRWSQFQLWTSSVQPLKIKKE